MLKTAWDLPRRDHGNEIQVCPNPQVFLGLDRIRSSRSSSFDSSENKRGSAGCSRSCESCVVPNCVSYFFTIVTDLGA